LLQAFEVLPRPGGKKQGDPEAPRVSEIDGHLGGADYLGCSSELFYLCDHSQVRNELAAAAEVAGGDRADEAGHGTLQRFCRRKGQLVGAVQVPRAQRGFADLQAFEDLALRGRSQSFDPPQLVLARRGLESSQVGNAELLVNNVDLLRL
jgi:hypothetical protein